MHSQAAFGQPRGLVAKHHSAVALWHLLSLDAPCVAALWTVFVARSFNVPLPWTAPAALSLAVWMLYAADRLADATAGNAQEERHRFHQRHRVAFALCWLLCAPVLLWLVVHLPHAVRDGWLLLAIPLAAYVGAVHAIWAGSVPKEPLIAAFFGLSVAIPVLGSGAPPVEVATAAVLYGLICWLNCAAIAAWESPWNGYLDPVTRSLGRHLGPAAGITLVVSLVIAMEPGPLRGIALAAAASSLALEVLQRLRRRMDRTHVRALADAALLSPLLLLAWHLL